MNRVYFEKLTFVFMIFSMIMIFTFPIAAKADTRYVSDVLVITLRAEPEKDSEVVRALRSDTPIEVLEETEEHLRVRTDANQEGWVVKRYITSNIPKPMIITELGEKINRLELSLETVEQTKNQLEKELEEIQNNQNNSIGEYKSAVELERKDAQKINKEYKVIFKKYNILLNQSQNVIQMSEKIKALENKNIKLRVSEKKNKQILLTLENDKKDLFRAAIIRWFLAGSGVLFVGMILGKLSRKKDYY
jgi:SH3 domain protein